MKRLVFGGKLRYKCNCLWNVKWSGHFGRIPQLLLTTRIHIDNNPKYIFNYNKVLNFMKSFICTETIKFSVSIFVPNTHPPPIYFTYVRRIIGVHMFLRIHHVQSIIENGNVGYIMKALTWDTFRIRFCATNRYFVSMNLSHSNMSDAFVKVDYVFRLETKSKFLSIFS